MADETLQKYLLVVVLFGVFLVMANLWAYKTGAGGALSRRGRRRHRRRPRLAPEESEEPPEAPGLLSRWSIWLSVGAMAVCMAALLVMWYAAGLGIATR